MPLCGFQKALTTGVIYLLRSVARSDFQTFEARLPIFQVLRLDFNDMNARTELQRRVFEEKKRKEENVWRERVRRIRVEMDEAREYEVALIASRRIQLFERRRREKMWPTRAHFHLGIRKHSQRLGQFLKPEGSYGYLLGTYSTIISPASPSIY